MKKIFTITLFLLQVLVTYGQEVTRYDMTVDFDIPRRMIRVNGTLQVDFQKQDHMVLVLWKNTAIQSIQIDKKDAVYSFDTDGKSPNYYIPNGGKLTIRNIPDSGAVRKIQFAYTCDMKNVSGWAKSFSEEWIELGFYTAWYPVHDGSNQFTSKIKVSIDPRFKVSGSGIISREGKYWTISHHWPVFDNVIIAARDLKTKKIGGTEIGLEFVYTKFPETDLEAVSKTCREVYQFYSSIFGKQKDAYLKYVINPLAGGGGYSRTKFVSFKASRFNQYLKEGIAHEMAHFWWNRAVTTTWEDWLNEAFAEYSSLLYLRERDSRQKFDEQIQQFREWTKKCPPIRGIDRATPEAYTALYNKGSLILLELENRLGTGRFYRFLRKILERNISNTADFLELVETDLSKEIREWFENKLNT